MIARNLFNLYGNSVEEVTEQTFINIISKCKIRHINDRSPKECLIYKQSQSGQTCYTGNDGWSHEVVYAGY